MNLFAESAELLGGTQTFVGVMIALIVLCIFHDKSDSNFLRRITESLYSGLTESNSSYINKLKESLKKPTDIAGDKTGILKDPLGWIKLAQGENSAALLDNVNKSSMLPVKFFNKAQEKIENCKVSITEQNERVEDAYIQTYLLVVSLFVFSLDAMHVSKEVGAFVLLFSSLLMTMFSIGMWVIYFFKIDPSAGKESVRRNGIARMSFVCTTLLLVWTVTSGIIGCCRPILGIVISTIFLSIVCGGFVCYNWKRMLVERYNTRFVINHAFYSIIAIIVCTLLLRQCMTSSCLVGICDGYFDSFYSNWYTNVSLILDIKYARIIFAAVLSFFGFFCPITLGLISTKIQSWSVKRQVKKVFEESQQEAKEIQNEYIEIVKKIFHAHSDSPEETKASTDHTQSNVIKQHVPSTKPCLQKEQNKGRKKNRGGRNQ